MKKLLIMIMPIILIFPFLFNEIISKKENECVKIESNNIEINKVNQILAYTCTTCETLPSNFPKKEDGYSVESVTCTNGAIGIWDHETWTLETSNMSGETSCLVNFMPGFKVSVIAKNENITITPSTISQIVYGEDVSFKINAKTGYGIRNLSCTNGTYDPVTHSITIDNITSDIMTECEVSAQELGNLLYSQILADNPNVSSRTSFSSAFTTSNNGNTIYSASGQGGKTTYYFAGAVTNNYVYFAGKYWRIVRINEDNSVRLLYAGTSVTDPAGFSRASQVFNSGTSSSEYVGYKYTIGSQYGNGTNSDIKMHLDEWYTSNFNSDSAKDTSGNKFDKYISKTAIYCNDRTVGSGTWSSSGSGFYYGAYTRLRTNKAPTFTCRQLNDRFTASSTTGNNQLHNSNGDASPIAIITADEVAYAGGVLGTNNTSYYIYQNASTGATYWWTLSPSEWLWVGAGVHMLYVDSAVDLGGRLNDSLGYAHTAYGVRPVISLKSCVEWSEGNGTAAHPYQVRINSSCISAEN